ncbi:hypothetical protein BjapCC829_21810 [Bradyrhizobium barranii]|uniref:Uncharacterized protein n=1 Tax=Bradyrhizobium barranii TaxID=2992140 RepID=A0ABY3QYT1_9BRAD|nr:hypothetical protein [Bradyrhizobium japonicum]UFW91027.1 hypothetical protein BjapCC829_21810 [Bradyrhizobium japonicum]
MQFGPQRLLGHLERTSDHISIPTDGLLTGLRIGRTIEDLSRFTLEIYYSPIVGIGQLHFDGLGGADKTFAQRGSLSKFVQLPAGGSWGDWRFYELSDPGLQLTWPGKVTNPGFALGPEEKGMPTKVPENGGGGALAQRPGWTITALQFTEDPSDWDVGLNLWYRQLL